MSRNIIAVQSYVTAILANPSNSLDKMETPANVVAFAAEIDDEVQKQCADKKMNSRPGK